jgi:uncharacterized integral membrane protein (TIGR00698 family)
MQLSQKHSNIIFVVIIILCFTPFLTPAIALAIGIVLSVAGIKSSRSKSYTSHALQASIVLMGFGMNMSQVLAASKEGFAETAVSVIFVVAIGMILTKLFKVESNIGILISAGTAICGGSAIAAVSPIIKAKNYQISFALIVVFVLNAIALMIFPPIGKYLGLSQEVFGHWAAIAIHDTSSVVGAGAIYGSRALEIATTVKLIRALWIIPLSFGIMLVTKDKSNGKIKIPWFIGLFVLAIITAYLLPQAAEVFTNLAWLGRKGMIVALFLIGANISFSEIKEAGIKSFLLGVILWFIIGISSLVALKL